jgi:hypothetical protein
LDTTEAELKQFKDRKVAMHIRETNLQAREAQLKAREAEPEDLQAAVQVGLDDEQERGRTLCAFALMCINQQAAHCTL